MGYQGLTLMGLYLLGFVMALLSAAILNKVLKIQSKTYFVIEMPNYKLPLLKNVGLTVFEKTKSFVVEAGKIILAISILLWIMASFGPGKDFNNAEEIVKENSIEKNFTPEELNAEIASYKLEHSFIGILGKSIEPAIAPLVLTGKLGLH